MQSALRSARQCALAYSDMRDRIALELHMKAKDKVAAMLNGYEEALTVHIFDVDGGLDDEQKQELADAEKDIEEAREQYNDIKGALSSCVTQMEQCEKMFREDEEFMAALSDARKALGGV